MSATTIQKTFTTDGIQYERWPARGPSANGHGHSSVQIVGVGEAGGGWAASLYYRTGIDSGIAFQQVAAVTDGESSEGAMPVASHVPFEGANAVIVIAATAEPDVLRVSAIVSVAARKAGARVVALLAQPPLPPARWFELSRPSYHAALTRSCSFPNLLTLPCCIAWLTPA
ncbi:hypothetical protein KTE49_22925 [Burkholderia multivorans]|uniref:hypothetical protein n=1 Tax=Burkholderia multivorans TaxID=87883 RepID=UPI00158C5CA1|nr:hypothetical protein [Burkholderia multivorans]MBJ9617712.1 hypothetical protein [Burkholderia multivorans]MBU9331431.1 hypothetical protein [Burkholderia multivorans]MBU9533291.1 hypothetical protein [Burkholderia multivorans]